MAMDSRLDFSRLDFSRLWWNNFDSALGLVRLIASAATVLYCRETRHSAPAVASSPAAACWTSCHLLEFVLKSLSSSYRSHGGGQGAVKELPGHRWEAARKA